MLTGGYFYGPEAVALNARPVAERLQVAREQGEKLHSDYSRHVEHGLAIGWINMEFIRMGWANEGAPEFGAAATTLATPQGRFCIAGDQVTYYSGWQEGAIISAWDAVRAIDRQVNPTATRRG